mgnify:CR=1 FL=1
MMRPGIEQRQQTAIAELKQAGVAVLPAAEIIENLQYTHGFGAVMSAANEVDQVSSGTPTQRRKSTSKTSFARPNG